MPKSPAQKENALRKRIESLEFRVKLKDDEVAKLASNFQDELRKRDKVISDLTDKIEQIELKNRNSNEITNTNENEELVKQDDLKMDEKTEHDLLVIGDSLVRNVNGEAINPGGDTTIECIPGARPENVAETFRQLSKTKSFKRVIVHVGSNLIPRYSPAYVADKITDCLDVVKNLSPSSRLAFSSVLPKIGNHLNPGINVVNSRVVASGRSGPSRCRYGSADHSLFFVNNQGQVNPNLFLRDGIHLSNEGVKNFENSLRRLGTVY